MRHAAGGDDDVDDDVSIAVWPLHLAKKQSWHCLAGLFRADRLAGQHRCNSASSHRGNIPERGC